MHEESVINQCDTLGSKSSRHFPFQTHQNDTTGDKPDANFHSAKAIELRHYPFQTMFGIG